MIIGLIVGWMIAIVMGAFAVKFGLLVLNLEDRIELSLDTLNEQYGIINTVLAVPLASDDQHARTVVQAIRKAHDAILSVANVLVGQRADEKRSESGESGE